MYARKTAALAIIAGLATATALTGTAGTAFADTETRTAPSKAAAASAASIKEGHVQAPVTKQDRKADLTAAGKSADRNATKGSLKAAAAYDCYQTANFSGTLCNYWNYNRGGSRGGIFAGDVNWSDNYYVTSGSGQWQRMYNNNASAWNWDAWLTARVYNQTGQNGAYVYIKPYVYGNYPSGYALNGKSNRWV